MKRLYTMMAVPLAAGLLFIAGCGDDGEPGGQPTNTPVKTATSPPEATSTRTSPPAATNTVPPTHTQVVPPTNTPTEGPTSPPTDTPTEGPTVAATDTPTEGPTVAPTETTTPGGEVVCGDNKIEGSETCDDGNNYGGDGCAANCTTEPATDLRLNLGNDDTSQSQSIVQAQAFFLSLKVTGAQLTTPGAPRDDASTGADGFTNFAPGEAPVANVISKNAGLIDPIKVPGLVCACLRNLELQTCGGRPVNPGEVDTICNNDARGGIDPNICPEDDPCKPTFGPDVGGAGKFGCNGASNLNYLFTADHATGAVTFVESGDPVEFGGQIRAFTAIGTIMDSGTCAEDTGNAAKGDDGIPCTDDDPDESRGTPSVQVQTTGTATAFVLHVNGGAGNIDDASNCGAAACQTTATGAAKSCSDLLQGNTEGLCLASAFGALSQPTTGDIVVPAKFCALAQ